MDKKFYIISLSLLVVIICLAIYFYHARLSDDIKKEHSKFDTQENLSENESAEIIDISVSPLNDDYKKKVAALIEKNISEIIQENPLDGGQWIVTEIRFINSASVLVEYEDGHNSFASQIKIMKRGGNFSFGVVK